MNLFIQKSLIIGGIFIINIILISLFAIYEKYWYAFIPILGFSSLLNSYSSINLWIRKIISSYDYLKTFRNNKTSFVYIIPTYNESEDEIKGTLDSLSNQILSHNDNKLMIIICDGKVIGKGNTKTTDKILVENILKNNISDKISFQEAYSTWDTEYNNLDAYDGLYNGIKYILLVKENNYGKRDGLVLIRRLLYQYNQKRNEHPLIKNEFLNYIFNKLSLIFNNDIEYIIGTDADTIFERNCSEELIKEIERRPNTVGCVGFVNVYSKTLCEKFNLFTLYQYAEYIFAQCLKRQQQAIITHKVNCLSGCVQILRVCGETCGDKILTKFNYKPIFSDNIFDHIRSYASEDRNHVCLMLSEYPSTETTQTLYANAYTTVPLTLNVFLSQRRRWNLGTITNDMLILTKPGIVLYERLSAFSNILSFIISPFILAATVIFIKTIILNNTLLMLYLSIIIIIPFFYAITIPIFIKQMLFREALYYWTCYIFYITTNSLMNMLTYSYALFNMDIISWGKTRQIKTETERERETEV